ncbi:MAG: hypothetical protein GF404_06600, partial [candidate division Zixibacteria bacterium]|nr:hypothetical protein [candidate division Zixibacteria bacterium]
MLKKRFLITALLMLFTLSFVQAYAQSGENDTVFVETVVLDGPPSVDTLIPVKIRLVNTFEVVGASLGFYYGSDDITIDSVSKVGASCAHINIYNSFAEPDSNLGVIGFVKLMEPQGVIPGDSLLSTLWFTVPAGTPEQFIP